MSSISSETVWVLTKYKGQNSTGENWTENRNHPVAVHTVPLCYSIDHFLSHKRRNRFCSSRYCTGDRQQDQNGAIGVLKDLETPVNSVAVWAKEAGHKVGIATSVSVDHATPAAFYAHAAGRSSYYSIGKDLYRTGFDFYAGSDFLEPVDKSGKDTENLYDLAAKNGYAIARGYKDYQKRAKSR